MAFGLVEDCHRQDKATKVEKHRCDRVEAALPRAYGADAIRLVALRLGMMYVASPRCVLRRDKHGMERGLEIQSGLILTLNLFHKRLEYFGVAIKQDERDG